MSFVISIGMIVSVLKARKTWILPCQTPPKINMIPSFFRKNKIPHGILIASIKMPKRNWKTAKTPRISDKERKTNIKNWVAR